MIKLLSRLPAYRLFRRTGRPRMLPMNLTISPSFRCNSRCRTCNIYKKSASELSLEEWGKVFRGLGRNPFWVTVSGGEPFLREDITGLVSSLYDECRPSIINIPTNGLLTERIPGLVGRIAGHCSRASLVINVSIDSVGEENDAIRGVPGSYERAVGTFRALKALGAPNLSVGIHTVISRFNVGDIPRIYEAVRALRPDSYVTEIAEERRELDTVGSGIAPEYGDYAKAVDFLAGAMKADGFSRVGRVARAFRTEYYRMTKRVLLEKKEIIPCYSGVASAHIAPDGDVWMCCVRAEPVGNLRREGFDFGKVWFSETARRARSSIRKDGCHCPLANASYTNMLHDGGAMLRVGWNFLSGRFA